LEPCGSSEDLEKDRSSLYDQSSSASSHQIFRIPSPLWQIHSNISWIMLSCSCLIFQIWKIGIIFKTSFHQQLGSMLLYIYSKAPKKREQVNFTTILLLDLIFSSMLSLFWIEFCYSHLKKWQHITKNKIQFYCEWICHYHYIKQHY
jgi:hypothetical protein